MRGGEADRKGRPRRTIQRAAPLSTTVDLKPVESELDVSRQIRRVWMVSSGHVSQIALVGLPSRSRIQIRFVNQLGLRAGGCDGHSEACPPVRNPTGGAGKSQER